MKKTTRTTPKIKQRGFSIETTSTSGQNGSRHDDNINRDRVLEFSDRGITDSAREPSQLELPLAFRPFAAMVFNVLFGSRVVPQVIQRSKALARPVVAEGQRSLVTSVNPTRALFAPSSTAMAGRGYGTRSFWNVSGAKVWLFGWFVGGSIVAGILQEIVGPYILFHE